MAERFLSPACLVVLSSKSYGTAPILIFSIALTVLLAFIKPYKGDRKNYRPIANCLIMTLIAGIFLGIGFIGDPESALSKYGPLVILVLLLVCIIYSAYALVQDLRQKCINNEIENEEK